MTQFHFGGGAADTLYGNQVVGSTDYMTLSGGTVTFWTAQTGGTQYTVTLNGSPTTSITVSPATGQIPSFLGPDGVTNMWADAGAGRVQMWAYDAIASITDSAMDAVLANPSSASAQLLAASYVPGGTAGNVDIWRPSTAYTAGHLVVDPYGFPVKLIASGTSGSSYNAAEAALWAEVSGRTTVQRFGAKGDGTTNDAPSIQAAINALAGASSVNATLGGGEVYFPAGTYVCGAKIVLPGGINLRGAGMGGDMRSISTPAVGVLPASTTLKLANGVNDDLIQTYNFGSLTGTASGLIESQYPHRFGIYDMVLDGNQTNQTGTSWCLRIYGAGYTIQNVAFQNGLSGGVYSEWQSGGADMESRWNNFRVNECSGDGLHLSGPHDSQFVNGSVSRSNVAPGGRQGTGINIVSSQGGGNWCNVHVWGKWNKQWYLSGGQLLVNCVSDGPGGITILSDCTSWVGGAIYSDNGVTAGDVGITFGDGTTRTIRACRIQTAMFNYGTNQMIHQVTANTTLTGNKYDIMGELGNQSQYTVGSSFSTTSATASNPWTQLTLVDASSFSAGGGNIYVSDGTTVARVAYTGKSGNTLTGIASQSSTINAGAAVWSFSTQQNGDWWDVSNPFDTAARGLHSTPTLSGLLKINQETQQFYGLVQIRNQEIRGYNSAGTFTVDFNGTLGCIQPGTSSGQTNSAKIWSGSGAPSSPGGGITYNLGDAYFRTDTPGTANQRLYMVTTAGVGGAAVWTGVL